MALYSAILDMTGVTEVHLYVTLQEKRVVIGNADTAPRPMTEMRGEHSANSYVSAKNVEPQRKDVAVVNTELHLPAMEDVEENYLEVVLDNQYHGCVNDDGVLDN